MKPLKDNPMKRTEVLTEEEKKYRSEVDEFISSGCKYAELWMNPRITIGANIERYKKIARHRRIANITFHQRDYRVVAIKGE